jgi:hypothetical protein
MHMPHRPTNEPLIVLQANAKVKEIFLAVQKALDGKSELIAVRTLHAMTFVAAYPFVR